MKIPSIAIITLLLTGCASESEEPEGEDPAAHACEQVGATGAPLTASESRDTAPVLGVSEQPYTVTLPNAVASFMRIDGPLDGLLFSKTANVVTGLFKGTDTADTLPASTPNEDCPSDIPEHFDLELADAGPFYVQLGPSAVSEIWLMLTEASGHVEH